MSQSDALEQIEAALGHRFLEAARAKLHPDTAPDDRKEAVERFLEMKLPGRKDEEWRFVRLAPLAAAEVGLPTGTTDVTEEQLSAYAVEEADARVVFVDGVFKPERSTLEISDGGVHVKTLMEGKPLALGEIAALLQDGQDYFVALHEALYTDGVYIDVGRDVGNHTVHVLHVTTGEADAALTNPRVFINVGMGSKVSVVEEHVSLSADATGVTNALVEVDVAENARVNHVKIQDESPEAFHVARTAARLAEGAHYQSVTLTFGAAFSRHDLHAQIDGGSTMAELHGLAKLEGRQVSDTHSVMNHASAHSQSDQLHKCVVDGKAHSVFNGKIFVRQDAQQVNAFQLNRNLLLSDRAKADTKPQLEIFADDVKCTHGATIGQLEDSQLFYLQTRGIDAKMAQKLLTYAFAAEVVERVPILSVRQRIIDRISLS